MSPTCVTAWSPDGGVVLGRAVEPLGGMVGL